MKAYITNDNLAKISATYRHKNKGWVKSYFDLDLLLNIKNDKYAVLIPNFYNNNIAIEGSITWGKSGFSFNLESTVLSNQLPYVSFQTHNGDFQLTEECVYNIIGSLLYFANEKATVLSTKDYRGWKFKAPTLKAFPRTRTITGTNKNNIRRHTANGVFDPIFAQFLIRHEDKGIRCDG
ncbi:Uncharacterised protein [Legionella busanensis]|uniref:Uncharacterized protein n=1 Tax=Legionella busanensis TaxID=190655 RepID=A0A378JS40_9GAMM|nr:hypothetical protein [Legionella busanensis]STX50972.1 Uncharacterised protein [Legionella busanensis]